MQTSQINAEIERVLSLIGGEPSVDRVFLFGSGVKPEQLHLDSDIDLCIVQRTEKRFYARLAEWISRLNPRVGMDLVVYTPEEFEEMSRNNYFVRSEITEKGREIYHAA